MPMYKVVIQKNVPGKSKPTERDRLARRRVVVVEAPARSTAERVARRPEVFGPESIDVVSVEPVGFVVLSP